MLPSQPLARHLLGAALADAVGPKDAGYGRH